MNKIENTLERWGILIMGIISIFFTLAPLFMRISSGLLPIIRPESYEYLWQIHNSSSQGVFTSLLRHILPILGNDQLLLIIPIVVMLCVSFIFYAILRELGLDRTKSVFSFIILLLSPIYAYLCNSITPYPIMLLLIMLSLYLGIRSKKFWFSLLIVLPVAAMNIIIFITFLAIAAMLVGNPHRYRHSLFFYTITGILIWFSSSSGELLFRTIRINDILTNFGSIFGYSLFTLILAFAGVYVAWSKKDNNYGHVLFLFLMVLSLPIPSLRVLVIFPLSVYASETLSFLLKRKWHVEFLKEATVLIIVSSLLFSSISYMDRIEESQPTGEFLEMMSLIASETRPGKVLGNPELGPLISYFSGKEAYISNVYDLQEKRSVYRTLMTTSSPSDIKKILDKEDIIYIYLDGQHETAVTRGILRAVISSENFIRLGSIDGQEVWLYIRL